MKSWLVKILEDVDRKAKTRPEWTSDYCIAELARLNAKKTESDEDDEEEEPLNEERLKDIVARIALAIQRGGDDYLGNVSSIHGDLIDLLGSYNAVRNAGRRALKMFDQMRDAHDVLWNSRQSVLIDSRNTLKALIKAKQEIEELRAGTLNKEVERLREDLAEAKRKLATISATNAVSGNS